MVLEKTLESPLDFKEINPVNPKGNQSWIFIGRTDDEAEAPVLWTLDAKTWLNGKNPDAGKDWRQDEKGTSKHEMLTWHHQLDGHGFEQAPGIGNGHGSLACCSPRVTVGHDWVTDINWEESITERRSEFSLKQFEANYNSYEEMWRFPGGSEGKKSACKAGDMGSVPGSGRSPGGGNCYPLQDSGLQNSMGRGAWWATVMGSLKVTLDWATNTFIFHFMKKFIRYLHENLNFVSINRLWKSLRNCSRKTPSHFLRLIIW